MTRTLRRRDIYTKEICACSIFGAMDRSGERFPGRDVIEAIANMHVRGNGLGGGFAAYGIYPQYEDYYAFHVMFAGKDKGEEICAKEEFEAYLVKNFDVVYDEEIPHCDDANVVEPPLVWRYFVLPSKRGDDAGLSDDEYVVRKVMEVNATMDRRVCFFSSGKNMGVFKGVGFPEDVADYSSIVATSGPLTAGFPPTVRPGGVGPIHSVCWMGPLSTTARYPPMAQTNGTWRCTATPAHS